ncbi:translation initiation factor IF-2-like isoform X1 [Phacochoerus africanus]|uniref:translation initiation factor IF-2-like isoform X1 n=1 Tax=Phacochoerus africanus TaxID=41426 RepID=UPI001FD90DF5|nr:translation initiation factor IF-2-like isoform X1 [Phacochoerus africanus]
MLPGGGWGRGRPTSAESAAPAAPMSPCPLPGKDAGGGGRGVRGSLRGAVRRLGIFWKVAPAGAGPPGSERVRGRAFPEERALPDNTEDGEAGGRPARREGSGSLLKALSQHGASACHPPSSNQAPQGQGPLKTEAPRPSSTTPSSGCSFSGGGGFCPGPDLLTSALTPAALQILRSRQGSPCKPAHPPARPRPPPPRALPPRPPWASLLLCGRCAAAPPSQITAV